MVVLRSCLLLFSLYFSSGEAFNVSHFTKLPISVDGECIDKEQYWSYHAEYCPGSSDDHSELYHWRLLLIFTNSSTEPQKIVQSSIWAKSKSMKDNDGTKGSLAENNRCGRCGSFQPCKNSGDYTSDYIPFLKAIELYNANQLGVDMFMWMERDSGVTGDNMMNYIPILEHFKPVEDKGNRNRYANGGAIRYKRLKIVGFAPMAWQEGLKIKDDSEYVLADVVNDCDKLDPKTFVPSHGLYRLMIDGEPRGKKSSFWWKSQYYYPLPGDYFT